MVQYKAMEVEGRERRFRWQAGDQLMKEIERMKALWKGIKNAGINHDPDAFRFSDNPFFLKFCPRALFRPDGTQLFPGLYLPLGLWERLCQSGRLKGPKGGNVLTYANARRWLSNTDFFHLVSRSWVGTSGRQSDILGSLIERLVEGERTTVFAAKHDPEGHVW